MLPQLLFIACEKNKELGNYDVFFSYETTTISPSGAEYITAVSDYNPSHYLIRVKNTNSFTNDYSIVNYDYDWESGVINYMPTYDDDYKRLVANRITTYDTNGVLISEVRYENEYNDKGYLVYSTCYHPDYTKTVEYTYDANNYITKKIINKNGAIQETTFTEIIKDESGAFEFFRYDSLYDEGVKYTYRYNVGNLRSDILLRKNTETIYWLIYWEGMELIEFYDSPTLEYTEYEMRVWSFCPTSLQRNNVRFEKYNCLSEIDYTPVNPIDPFQYEYLINQIPPHYLAFYNKVYFDL